jgi:hypothetical protein
MKLPFTLSYKYFALPFIALVIMGVAGRRSFNARPVKFTFLNQGIALNQIIITTPQGSTLYQKMDEETWLLALDSNRSIAVNSQKMVQLLALFKQEYNLILREKAIKPERLALYGLNDKAIILTLINNNKRASYTLGFTNPLNTSIFMLYNNDVYSIALTKLYTLLSP